MATGIDASEIPIELVFEAGDKYRVPLIGALLENGASPNGLRKRRECPLELALEAEDYTMVVTLLQYNADPTCIVTKAGDSLLHEALKQLFATGLLFRHGLNPPPKKNFFFIPSLSVLPCHSFCQPVSTTVASINITSQKLLQH